MITWAIHHAPYVGVAFLGYAAGVIRAASVQLRRENLDRWLVEQKRINRVTAPPPR